MEGGGYRCKRGAHSRGWSRANETDKGGRRSQQDKLQWTITLTFQIIISKSLYLKITSFKCFVYLYSSSSGTAMAQFEVIPIILETLGALWPCDYTYTDLWRKKKRVNVLLLKTKICVTWALMFILCVCALCSSVWFYWKQN